MKGEFESRILMAFFTSCIFTYQNKTFQAHLAKIIIKDIYQDYKHVLYS